MTAPGKEERNGQGDEDRPSHSILHHKKPEYEEQKNSCTDINRTAGKRHITEVHRRARSPALGIGAVHARIDQTVVETAFAEVFIAAAANISGDEQRNRFADTVAPIEGVFHIQAFAAHFAAAVFFGALLLCAGEG